MRIISGKYKGQVLNSFSASHIRPTTDRVKESLFNILQSQIPQSRVLDLFSGTGNLGIESLSRGAASVTFVESHPQSLSIIRKNIEKLKVSEPYDIISKDVISFLKNPPAQQMDVIFADPPFTKAMADEVMQTIAQTSLFAPHTVMAIESAKKEKLEDRYGSLSRIDQRIFGDKVLSFFALFEA